MKEGLIAIGKMAEINHVSIQTLRLYDKLGLLPPRHIDPESGYRYYDIHQNARLDMIAYMKDLSMSLSEIRTILQKEDISLIEEVLGQKNELLHRQMRELKDRHDAVERTIANIERYRKSPVTGTTSLEYIDRRYVWGIPCKKNFYRGDIGDYEQELSRLRQELLERSFQQLYSYNTGTSITQTDFEQGSFQPKDVFIFMEKEDSSLPGQHLVDSGMFGCIYADQYNAEIPCAKKLLTFCQENHYRIAGDYFCEVMTEFNVFSSQRRGMFLKLQVPVTFR